MGLVRFSVHDEADVAKSAALLLIVQIGSEVF